MRILIATLLAGFLLSGQAFAAQQYQKWSEDHAAAKRQFLALMEKHPRLHDDLAAANEEKPETVRDWVEFLAGKGDRNTNDFVEKNPKETRLIKRMHEREGEEVRAFREWIRDHEKSATDLVAIKDGLKHLLAEGGDKDKPKRFKKD